MKYEAIVFDFGGTLAYLDGLTIPNSIIQMIKTLYSRGYRLAIISNGSRYQDGFWLRNHLWKYGLLQYFEAVVCSSVWGVSKPEPEIFQRVVQFLGVNPKRILMVGDTPTVDGGARTLGMDYLEVHLKQEDWVKKLMKKLKDHTFKQRKLTHITEYIVMQDYICPKINHLSTPIEKGDHIIVKGKEYKVIDDVPKTITKDMILNDKESRIPLKLQPIDQ